MAAISLPYLSTPGTLDKALPRIKEAAKPDRVNANFVNSVLQIKGGTGAALIPFFKKIGFISSDGIPTSIFERYRNRTSAGHAMAEAIRHGYKGLYRVNEYAHKLSDPDLKGLIVQVTGLEESNNVVKLIASTFKRLRTEAVFEELSESEGSSDEITLNDVPVQTLLPRSEPGLNLSYTINLNLPATTNIDVYHAIFRSLREHLLKG